jgi:hypothetical protein
MSCRKRAFIAFIGILFFTTPVLAQKKDPPSPNFLSYRGPDFELRFPDNWIVTKTGDTVTLSPEDGNVDGTLAYGLLMDIFEPRNRNLPEFTSISNAMDLLIEELKHTRPNLRVLSRAEKEIGGLPAVVVEMSNTSPVGGLEVDRLLAVGRSTQTVRYFLAVAPQAEMNRYNSIFSRMIESIRFYN